MYDVSYRGIRLSSLVNSGGKSWIHLRRRPVVPAPIPDVTSYVIPGRDAELTINEGTFRPIDIKMDFSFTADNWEERLADFFWWLLGGAPGQLKFGNLSNSQVSNWYYKVLRITPGDVVRETNRIGQVPVTFTCEPYRYHTVLATQSMTAGYNSYNTTTFELPDKDAIAKPIIDVKSNYTGQVYLLLNSTNEANAFKLNISTSNQWYHIDTDKFMITVGSSGTLANSRGDGEYKNLWLSPDIIHTFRAKQTASTYATVNIKINYYRRRL